MQAKGHSKRRQAKESYIPKNASLCILNNHSELRHHHFSRIPRPPISYWCIIRIFVPGHALHEKGLQRQKNVSPPVRSQEQRAPLGPLINRLSTSFQPVVNRSLGYGPCGGSRYSWREPLRMSAMEGASSMRPSPPCTSPHPTLPFPAP